MDRWDLEELGLEPRHPQVLLSEDGAARVIALLLAPWPGAGHPNLRNS